MSGQGWGQPHRPPSGCGLDYGENGEPQKRTTRSEVEGPDGQQRGQIRLKAIGVMWQIQGEALPCPISELPL